MEDQYCSLRVSRSAISFGSVCPVTSSNGRRKRGAVHRFSEKSKARLLRYLADCRSDYCFFGTLTVGNDWSLNGARFKEACDRFLSWFMRRQREECSVHVQPSLCWFLEFQKRGAPHLHFFYTHFVSWKVAAPKWVECLERAGASEIDGVAEVGTKFELLRGGREQTLHYARKYAAKLDQKKVPETYRNPGRFWGVRGLRHCDSVHELIGYELGGKDLLIQIHLAMLRWRNVGPMRIFKWKERPGFVVAAPDRAQQAKAFREFTYEVNRLLARWYVMQGMEDHDVGSRRATLASPISAPVNLPFTRVEAAS